VNTSNRFGLSAAIILSLSSASALADPTIVLDHVAYAGPRHDALVQCVDAVRSNPAMGQGLMFSTRMGVSQPSASGTRTFILSGTAWENGERVPVTARCVVGPGSTVASVTRINDGPAIANAAR
jgi:hypothetical protein